MELLKLEGADAIQELHRVALELKNAVLPATEEADLQQVAEDALEAKA
jgi:hypothetical protein